MNAFMDKLQAFLLPLSDKLNRSKILRGISGGFSAMLPIVMVGAIFSLLNSLNIQPYQDLITAIGLKPLLAIPGSYTTDMISIYAVFLIAKAEAEAIGIDNRKSVSSGLIALLFFLLLILCVVLVDVFPVIHFSFLPSSLWLCGNQWCRFNWLKG